jgi:serine/threonine protein kinase
MSFTSGDNIYKFTLQDSLGGNFGEVWKAKDNTTDKIVALKILEASFEPIAKTLDEARIGNKFNHKNLLPIHYADVVPHNGKTYTLISQEYFQNGDITNNLNSNNFLPLPVVLKILQDILFGLEYLHNGGFYHNDIKPANILLDDNRNGVLADYGISGFSPTTSPVTPKNSYRVQSAPETSGVDPKISIASDIYQVGCTAYRLLNGISNLKNEYHNLGPVAYEVEKANGKIPDTKRYEPFVPRALKTILNKALNVNPDYRFSSALKMRRKLEKLYFPGYWTSDTNSDLIGKGVKYHYQFEIMPKPGNMFDFVAKKTNILSNKTTKISAFNKKNLSNKELINIKNKFITWVIENAS